MWSGARARYACDATWRERLAWAGVALSLHGCVAFGYGVGTEVDPGGPERNGIDPSDGMGVLDGGAGENDAQADSGATKAGDSGVDSSSDAGTGTSVVGLVDVDAGPTQICTPNSVRCEGDTALRCDAVGGAESVEDCALGVPQCKLGVCVAGVGCSTEAAPDATPCDDGAFCTLADTCAAGVCKGSGDPCISSTCATQICSEAFDVCVTTPTPDGTACGTDLACNSGACVSSDNCSGDCWGACTGAECGLSCNGSTSCTYECFGGQDCSLDCADSGDCSATCSGVNSDCVVDCNGAEACETICSGAYADCQTDCRGAGTCSTTTLWYGESVTDCRGADSCEVECYAYSDCLLYCDPFDPNCGFTHCASYVRNCGGGLFSCGSDCPPVWASFPPSELLWPVE